MKVVAVLSSSLLGVIFVLGTNTILAPTLATGLGVVVAAWILRGEGVYGHYAIATAFVYLITWFVVTSLGWGSAGFLQSEIDALFLFGLLGGLYTGLQILLQRGTASIRRFTTAGVVEKILSALFGAATVLAIAWQFKKLVSVRSFAAVGIVPGIAINYLFRTTDFGVVTELIVAITSVATIGFILAAAFLADSMSHAVSGVNRIRGTEENEAVTVLRPDEFESLDDAEFLSVINILAHSAHEYVEWHTEIPDGTAIVYAQTGTVDELIVGRRGKCLPLKQDSFELEVLREIEAAVDQLGHIPTRVCFVTDIVLDDEFFLTLRYRGFDVVDAKELHKIGFEQTPTAEPQPRPVQ